VENLFAQQAVLAVWDRETNATRAWMVGRLNVMSIHAAPMWLGDQERLLVLTRPDLVPVSQRPGSDKAAAGPNPAPGVEQNDETIHVMQTSTLRKTEGQVNTKSEFQSEDKETLHCDVTEVNANTGTARTAAKDIYPLDWSLSPSGRTFILANQKSEAPDSYFVKLDVVAIGSDSDRAA
jgi:hypothetical protein